MKRPWAWILVLSLTGLAAACSDDATNCHDEECVPHGGHGGSATGGGGNGEGGTALAKTYCDCMLLACHDAYHDTFGPDTDEPAARAACIAQASALPEAGMDVDMGNSVECRIHYCEIGRTDESVCPNTVGGVCGD